MKNFSSFVYFKKNRLFCQNQNQNLFKMCIQKNELNLHFFQNFTAFFPLQFFKSFQKKKKDISMSSDLFSNQKKNTYPFVRKKMKKIKDFCFFFLFEFFFLTGTYVEKFQFFYEMFFSHVVSLFSKKQNSVLEIEKNSQTSKQGFLVSVLSFFFFFPFEKQVSSQKNGFPKKRSQKKISNREVWSLIWKRVFLKSLFFFFQTLFQNFHNFLCSFSLLSQKTNFLKLFHNHLNFWFPDFSLVFPFLSRDFCHFFFQKSFIPKHEKCERAEYEKKKQLFQSFFYLFYQHIPKIESFFRPFEILPSWVFEKKYIQTKSSFFSFQIFNFFHFAEVDSPKRFSLFSKKSLFSFRETNEIGNINFKKNGIQTRPYLIVEKNSKHFFLVQAFQKSFFHTFLSCPKKLFAKMQILFFSKANKESFFLFKKRSQIGRLFFGFRSLSEKICFLFVQTKIFLCLLCRQCFDQCFFWKLHIFCLFSPQKFPQNFEDFFLLFFKSHQMVQLQERFQFFQKEKKKNLFFPFLFFSSFCFFRNFSLKEKRVFSKNRLFFPKKSLVTFGKTHTKIYDSFPFVASFSLFFRFFKKRIQKIKRQVLFFCPKQKTFFPFLFEKSLFFVFFQYQPSFKKLFCFGKIPHREEVRSHLQECQKSILQSRGKSQLILMKELSKKIYVWCKRNKSFFSKEIFEYCDCLLFKSLWKWAQRRHPNKKKIWIQKKYFHYVVFKSKKKWLFGKKMHHVLTCVPLHSHV